MQDTVVLRFNPPHLYLFLIAPLKASFILIILNKICDERQFFYMRFIWNCIKRKTKLYTKVNTVVYAALESCNL